MNATAKVRLKKVYGVVLTGMVLAVAAFIFVIPVLRLLQTSVVSDGALTLDAYRYILNRPATWRATLNSVFISVTSTFGALIVGTMLAWLVAYTDLRFVGCIRFLAFLPFILPSYGIALAWRLFLSPNGAIAGLFAMLPGSPSPPGMYGYGGIIFMHITTTFPPVFLLMTAALQRVPRDIEWAARASGLGNARVFFKINLPVLAPAFVSAGAIAFLSIIDNFGIPAILGLPAGIRVLPTYIYEQIAGMGRSAFARGAALSVLLIALSLAVPLMQKLLVRAPAAMDAVRPEHGVRVSLRGARTPVSLILLVLLASLSVVPVFSMAGISLKQAMGLPLSAENFTFENFAFVLFENVKSRRAIVNSLSMAFVCTVLCMIIGTFLAVKLADGRSRWPRIVEAMIQIPYSVPGIVLSLCMILFWMQPLPGWFPNVYGTYKILLIVYITRFLFVQTKAGYSAIAGFDRHLQEAARACGSSPLSGWLKVILPLLIPGILSGAVMVFVGVLTELTLSSLLWSSGSETIGTVILSYEQAGTLKYSSAMSSIVCILVIVLFFLSRLPGIVQSRTRG